MKPKNIIEIKKENTEREICEIFLKLYNLEFKKNISYIRPGNIKNREPDCVCSDNIFIEVTSCYDSDYQASKINNAKFPKEKVCLLSPLDNLQNIIANKHYKLEKEYYKNIKGKIILICKINSNLLTDEDIDNIVKEYNPFKQDNFFNKYFYNVWILWENNLGVYKIIELE